MGSTAMLLQGPPRGTCTCLSSYRASGRETELLNSIVNGRTLKAISRSSSSFHGKMLVEFRRAVCSRRSARGIITCMSWNGPLAPVKLIMQGKHFEVTEPLKAYVEKRVGRAIQNQAHLVMEVDVRLSARATKLFRCEVTIFTKKHGVVRAEDETDHMYSAVDAVSGVIGRKMRKLKEKDGSKRRVLAAAKQEALNSEFEAEFPEVEEEPPVPEPESFNEYPAWEAPDIDESLFLPPEEDEIVRVKYFHMPRLKPDEARDYMKNVGHDFYAFRNTVSGEVNILYKRKKGGYGMIVPVEEDSAALSAENEAVRN